MENQLKSIVDDFYETLLINKDSFESQFKQEKTKSQYISGIRFEDFQIFQKKLQSNLDYKRFQCSFCHGYFESGQSLGGHVSKSHQMERLRHKITKEKS